jgi:L-2-hydroxyglutarate oxidase LhgO
MTLDRVDTIIAGAGVVGLAVARALSMAGRDVFVLEAEPSFGMGTSSRNSEVVHAGIYYAPESLKATLCVDGRDRLYRYCDEHGVSYRRVSKLIVATEGGQQEKLESLAANAIKCGVNDLSFLEGNKARALEPELRCEAALLSPSTGIIDSHGFMLALLGEAQAHGAQFVFNTKIEGGEVTSQGIKLEASDSDGERFAILADVFINAAGLAAPELARCISGLPAETIPKAYFARGRYFTLNGRTPFSRLIYPVPVPGGLGVHLTLDLSGAARFGPDVEWIDTIDYRVDPSAAKAFYSEIRRYWPRLPDDALAPAYAGVRPKICGPGERAADFRIDGPVRHGVPGLVNLFGIESPGLTASLSLAEAVKRRIDG